MNRTENIHLDNKSSKSKTNRNYCLFCIQQHDTQRDILNTKTISNCLTVRHKFIDRITVDIFEIKVDLISVCSQEKKRNLSTIDFFTKTLHKRFSFKKKEERKRKI